MSTRRLAAILAADVVGYSRLMEADEEGTLARLKECRRDVIDPKIAEHRGRVVKTTGDGVLVEFASAVDASRCAIELQHAMSERNLGTPQDRRIEIRIGIHVGDIIIDEDDIFGDGVNIAARLEGVAEPGGISISGTAYDQVRDRLPYVFEDGGERVMKNIARPVRVWRMREERAAEVSSIAVQSASDLPLALPDKPSIAVLPFQNMSGDPEQEYFADGVVEDIITALSRVKWFFVIARNSSFTYKGKAVDIRQVGRELGVRYVLEGSIRKAGNRVRITGQLIEAATGTHVWADRFEGALDDIFALQDEVTSRVVAVLEPNLRQAEARRASSKATENLTAYDLCLRAMHALHQAQLTRQQSDDILRLLRTALSLDPTYAQAAGWAAMAHTHRKVQRWLTAEDAVEGLRFAEAALRDHRDDPATVACAAHTLVVLGRRYDAALKACDLAMTLCPDLYRVSNSNGWVRLFAGDHEAAITSFERSIRVGPLDPRLFSTQAGIAMGHWLAGRYEEGLAWAQKSMRQQPEWLTAYRASIHCLVALGRLEEAQQISQRLLKLRPDTRISTERDYLTYRDPAVEARILDGLRLAGIPE